MNNLKENILWRHKQGMSAFEIANVLSLKPEKVASIIAQHCAEQKQAQITEVVIKTSDHTNWGITQRRLALACESLRRINTAHAEQMLSIIEDMEEQAHREWQKSAHVPDNPARG